MPGFKRICSLALFLVLCLSGASLAMEAKLSPARVKPGGPFVLTVLSNPEPPSARYNGRELAFGSCGEGCYMALGAADLEAPPGDYEILVNAGPEVMVLSITVEEESFPVQRLTLPDSKVFLSPEDQARADREALKLSSIFEAVSPERYFDGKFVMPLENSFSTEFGVRRIMNGKKNGVHRGVDIRGSRGEPVAAANSGRVVMAEETFYGGNTLVLDHGIGVYTLYMHMDAFNVSEGDIVSKGQVVGFVGSTGRSTGPHLHYGLKINSVTANPVSVTRLPLP